jgi:hypothetical protein
VLGIVGICCGQLFLVSVGAIVTGVLGRKQIAESQGRQKGSGMALAGVILGAVGLLVGVAYWILIATGAINANFYMDNG